MYLWVCRLLALFLHLQLSDAVQPRAGHTANAISLGPGLTEVVLLGGMVDPFTDSDADTTLLQFSEWYK